jgi:hypothetical protein
MGDTSPGRPGFPVLRHPYVSYFLNCGIDQEGCYQQADAVLDLKRARSAALVTGNIPEFRGLYFQPETRAGRCGPARGTNLESG